MTGSQSLIGTLIAVLPLLYVLAVFALLANDPKQFHQLLVQISSALFLASERFLYTAFSSVCGWWDKKGDLLEIWCIGSFSNTFTNRATTS